MVPYKGQVGKVMLLDTHCKFIDCVFSIELANSLILPRPFEVESVGNSVFCFYDFFLSFIHIEDE